VSTGEGSKGTICDDRRIEEAPFSGRVPSTVRSVYQTMNAELMIETRVNGSAHALLVYLVYLFACCDWFFNEGCVCNKWLNDFRRCPVEDFFCSCRHSHTIRFNLSQRTTPNYFVRMRFISSGTNAGQVYPCRQSHPR
jgi:hypothetical protein